MFVIPGFYRPHPFTMSSAPEEEYIAVSTRVREGSRYKQKMMRMEPGDAMLFVGPILNYTFKRHIKNYVFLAQGIGITPFRSMLVHAHTQSLPVRTTLIHVDGRHHTFKEVTQKYATHAFYPTNPEEFRLKVLEQDMTAGFYLSGSPKFISATRKLLGEQGVKRNRIRVDSFLGY
jgi:glycine betaine catabolism B